MLNRDFQEFIESLSANRVRYMVIGGYAVAYHGHPRHTKDLDVWVDPDTENAQRLLRALSDIGFGSLGLCVEDFTDPEQVVQLGRAPVRIALLSSVADLEFDVCYPKRETEVMDDTPVDFIDLESLKRSKRAAGRHQDLADLENLSPASSPASGPRSGRRRTGPGSGTS